MHFGCGIKSGLLLKNQFLVLRQTPSMARSLEGSRTRRKTGSSSKLVRKMNRRDPALLDLQNVSVMRGQKVVLENFSLRIRGDEHVAILGPNGCGKSTLIKTITRECYPVAQEGSSMTILGQERWDVFELRSLLGIVSNDLMSTCTGNASGRDVVLSGFFSSTRIFPHHTVDSRHRELADSALAQLQISPWQTVLSPKCRREKRGACLLPALWFTNREPCCSTSPAIPSTSSRGSAYVKP